MFELFTISSQKAPGNGYYVEVRSFKDREKRKVIEVLISVCIV